MWVEVAAGSPQEAEVAAAKMVEAAGFGSVVSAVAGKLAGGFALVKVAVSKAAAMPAAELPLNWV